MPIKASKIIDNLHKITAHSCDSFKSEEILIEQGRFENEMIEIELMENNQLKYQIMADICHVLVIPVKWLIFTGQAYGCGECFKEVPLLLENIRKIFLFKFDKKSIFDFQFKEKLDFIRSSLDFHLFNRKPCFEDTLTIYNKLKSEFIGHVDNIISKLYESIGPFTEFSTGLGCKEISIPNYFNINTSNEDLWVKVMERVESISDEISFKCPLLERLFEMKITFIINEDILSKCHNNDIFSIKKAHEIITKNFKYYTKHILSSVSCDDVNFHEIEDEIKELKTIFDSSMRKYQVEIQDQILEIKSLIGFSGFYGETIDFSIIAASLLTQF